MIVKNRKGISTFIATLLLMVLAVAAGVVIYAYTMGYLGGFGSPQTMGAISIDTATMVYTPTEGRTIVTAYIRNIGKTSFTAQNVYADGVQLVSNQWSFTEPTIAEGGVGALVIDQGATASSTYVFNNAVTYTIKIIGVDNTQLTFQVKP
jgi:hypothetical protein